jgi:BirA family transcriptional regulator, biotin operon repressor / biotin---[acetyl-CoA-carboxylase] ligase
VHLDTVASTNDRARALVLAGAPKGTVVVAEEQTAGRGRQGRSWTAPRGSALTATVLWELDELLGLATAVAVCEACEAVAALTCQIKWPNDVWARGRKLAGILIEARPQERWAVIGIGLNVDTSEQQFEPDLAQTATSLRVESGETVGRDLALDALLVSLAKWYGELEQRRGGVLEAYRWRDALRGRSISWDEGLHSGSAEGIDDHGNLIVFSDAGERLTLSAGEVHLRLEDH